MKRWSFALAVVGSVLVAAVLVPVRWLERGSLPAFTAGYFWMMIAPAIGVALVLAYQWNLRIDRRSSIALIVLGVGTALYPMWGPLFWPSMAMDFGWIGTILSMYLPGVLVAVAGLLQLRLAAGDRVGRRYTTRGASTS